MAMVAFAESVHRHRRSADRRVAGARLNQQKAAPNITNVVSADQIGSFPDRNAAETTQRIPACRSPRIRAKGRYVNVRGTEPRLNAMMIDGQRIPSPDPLIRQVPSTSCRPSCCSRSKCRKRSRQTWTATRSAAA
jgi:outer membrane receptor for ferrienterochelin and colicin